MKKPTPPTIGTTKPRNDFGPREVLAIAAALDARRRAQLSRLSSAGRLRKWGDA